ncbi:MAG: serine hydrolase [Oscillospiraceae bacterium]
MKKVLSLLLACTIILSAIVPTAAADKSAPAETSEPTAASEPVQAPKPAQSKPTEASETPKPDESTKPDEKSIPVTAPITTASTEIPETGFDAYVVMEVSTGQVLIEKNMDKQEYPASITKILTALLALENGNLDDKITISYDATHSILANSTHIALTEGEEVTMEPMLYATMIQSANDAANVLAEYVGGSLDNFAVMMNERAKKSGAVNSHFTNAHGLPDKNHYTTAYDMALITRTALSVPDFRKYFGALEYTMQPTNKQPKTRKFETFDHMLVDSKYYYPDASGGKLGWTEESNHTIVTVAKHGDIELIVVGLNTTDKWGKYSDTAALFDYCFNNMSQITLKSKYFDTFDVPLYNGAKQVNTVHIVCKKDYHLLLHNSLDQKNVLKTTYNIPKQFNSVEEINPSLTITMSDTNNTMVPSSATLPMEYELKAVGAADNSPLVATPKTLQEKAIDIAIVLLKVLVVLLVIFLIPLLIIRQINLARYRKISQQRNRQKRRDGKK